MISGFVPPSVSPFVSIDSTHCTFVIEELRKELIPESGKEELKANGGCPCPCLCPCPCECPCRCPVLGD